MSTETEKFKGMSAELLQRYVEARLKIDAQANSIYAITSLLALMENCGDDQVDVDPVALGKINLILNKNILNIWEILDDYIYIVQAQSALADLELLKTE